MASTTRAPDISTGSLVPSLSYILRQFFPKHVLLMSFVIVSGNGCGHTVLGPESGTLASQNYPGTYPSNTWCKWRLRVPEGRMLRLLFGDFDIESSPGCRNGSLVITDKNGVQSLGKIILNCVFQTLQKSI